MVIRRGRVSRRQCHRKVVWQDVSTVQEKKEYRNRKQQERRIFGMDHEKWINHDFSKKFYVIIKVLVEESL